MSVTHFERKRKKLNKAGKRSALDVSTIEEDEHEEVDESSEEEEENNDDYKLESKAACPEILISVEELNKQMRTLEIDSGEIHTYPGIISTDYNENPDPKILASDFKKIYDKWFGEEAKSMSEFALAHWVFGLSIKNMREYHSEEVIDRTYSHLINEIATLNLAYEQAGIMSQKDDFVTDRQKQFNAMYELLYNSKNLLAFTKRMQNSRDMDKANSSPEKYDLFRFSPMVESKNLDDFESLYLYIMRKCSEKHYRKMKGDLYKEKKIRDKYGKEYGTYNWERVCSIREFIHKQCNPRTNWDMWRSMMKGSNLEKAVKHITEINDPQLPDLKRDRSVSSWKNGLWFAEYAAFYPYTNARIPGLCSAVYIDETFDIKDYGSDYMNIPCVVKKILSDQGYNRDEQSFILGVALGRLLFEPGKYDKWEIIPFLWGLAQTGKSCIVEAIKRLFHEDDVASVGNSIEKTFGLAPLIGKLLWIANDVRKNFGMDAGDLQTMTSNENMSVAKKYQDAISLKWDVPGIIAGNEIPRSWVDTLKSLERRILMVVFPYPVKRDNKIKLKLEKQRSLFFRLITYAYHDWQRKCGKKNIWDCAPPCFRENRKIIQEHENSLEMFLNNCLEIDITKKSEHYMTLEAFNLKYAEYCRANSLRQKSLSNLLLKNVLSVRDIRWEYAEKVWPPADDKVRLESDTPLTTKTGEFLIGIRYVKSRRTA